MKILWISWKDSTHPDAGGAERVGEQHAKAWIRSGHSVHWVSSGYQNSKKYIKKNGITYEHIGKKWYVYAGLFHLLVLYKYATKWKNEYDLIIDEYHGVPTGMPLYVRKPMIAIIHEVAGNIWQKMFPFPINLFGQYIAEPVMVSLYKKTPIITVSESTKNDLVRYGIPEKNIIVIPNGTDSKPRTVLPVKQKTCTLIYVSELRPIKGFERVYSAFKEIKKKIPTAKLWVIGNDTTRYAHAIKQKIMLENMTTAVTFFGKVSEEEKNDRLARAHILVHGSYKEGWGLVVIEANANGTIAIAFNAHGLCDSIQNNKTGYLVNNQNEFVNKVIEVYNDPALYQRLQSNALQWSKKFTWENATNQSLQIIEKIKNKWKY